ncbi:MAG: hypothetical protein H7250_00305, partial [Flavobacterium sp.]|nr:hypothetical protein [Flavobacterium sp.]
MSLTKQLIMLFTIHYPEIVTGIGSEERLLKFLSESYLYKDIFLFKGIKKPEKILELLRLL